MKGMGSSSGAESQSIISRLASWAGPEGSATRFIIGVDVRVLALALEVVVIRNTGRRAGLGSVVRSRAAGGRVTRVSIDQAVGLAADDSSGGIGGALEVSGAVRVKIDITSSDVASDAVINTGRDVKSINKGNIIVVIAVGGRKRPFGKGSGRNARTSVGITLKTTIATASKAGVGSGVGGEVAVAASPDTTSSPVIRDAEGTRRASVCLPSSRDIRSSGSDVQIGEYSGPDSVATVVLYGERTGGSREYD